MSDTIHYEVQSKPDPAFHGMSGIYEVVRMNGDTVIEVIATFKGHDRDRAYSTAVLLDVEMRKWREERRRTANDLLSGDQPQEERA